VGSAVRLFTGYTIGVKKGWLIIHTADLVFELLDADERLFTIFFKRIGDQIGQR